MKLNRTTRYFVFLICGLLFSSILPAQDLSKEVLIRRTAYGVPHIEAENIKAASFAMGYLQVEDYGQSVINGLVRAKGEWAKNVELNGRSSASQIDRDAAAKLRYARAEETYDLLSQDTRDLLEGYVAGVNRYIETHPEEFPDWVKPDFIGMDAHAKSIGTHSGSAVRDFIRALNKEKKETAQIEKNVWGRLAAHSKDVHPDVGSNAWALAPERTRSGKAILVRNPHLSWGAGYYEAHMVVPGKFDFYGDFRMGNPLGIVGGFNQHLGWSTTNNYPDTDEIYALQVDPSNSDAYLLDGSSHALEKQTVQVAYKTANGIENASRDFWFTEYGPVIHRDGDKIYIIRATAEGEYRTNEQFLNMMKASNLEEWKEAMRTQAKQTSNFTYADADGNIFYVWNASMPDLPLPNGGDTTAVFVESSDQIWSDVVDWDTLPQLLNPKGGYLHNENDPFHFTNLNEVFDPKDYPDNFNQPRLRLRSQLSLQLIGQSDKLSLEEVVERKHNMRILLADRVKPDLIEAVKATEPKGEAAKALRHLEKWDNTVAAKSRGGILFKTWWERYVELANGGKDIPSTPESAGYDATPESLFEEAWSFDKPTTTPNGLASDQHAVEAFLWAIEKCKERYGDWNLRWGEVHRAKIGDQDYPVGGATGDLGAFRVLWYIDHKEDDKKLQVRGGDGWVLAVEFGDTPRAYSVLAYGNSSQEDSPYYADQLKMFTKNKMKKVAYTKEDIEKQTVRTYRPGEEVK